VGTLGTIHWAALPARQTLNAFQSTSVNEWQWSAPVGDWSTASQASESCTCVKTEGALKQEPLMNYFVKWSVIPGPRTTTKMNAKTAATPIHT